MVAERVIVGFGENTPSLKELESELGRLAEGDAELLESEPWAWAILGLVRRSPGLAKAVAVCMEKWITEQLATTTETAALLRAGAVAVAAVSQLCPIDPGVVVDKMRKLEQLTKLNLGQTTETEVAEGGRLLAFLVGIRMDAMAEKLSWQRRRLGLGDGDDESERAEESGGAAVEESMEVEEEEEEWRSAGRGRKRAAEENGESLATLTRGELKELVRALVEPVRQVGAACVATLGRLEDQQQRQLPQLLPAAISLLSRSHLAVVRVRGRGSDRCSRRSPRSSLCWKLVRPCVGLCRLT